MPVTAVYRELVKFDTQALWQNCPRRLILDCETGEFGALFDHVLNERGAILPHEKSRPDNEGAKLKKQSSMETTQKKLRPAWLYDGEPEYVDLNVGATSSVQGGYVVALELTNGTIRLAATRHPAKYVTAWRHNVRRYGLPDVVRVLVSRPYLRYEAIKRGLASKLAGHKEEESDAYRLDVEAFAEKAREVFAAAGM